jgi:hypothetical protein
VYLPALLGVARVHFVRSTYQVDQWQDYTLLREVDDFDPQNVWQQAVVTDAQPWQLVKRPDEGIQFGPLPSALTSSRNYAAWAKQLKDHLYQTRTLPVWYCPELKQYSRPPEAQDEFRIRLTQVAREQRDLQVEKLRKRYASKAATLQARLRRAQQRLERETEQYSQQKYQSAISFGTSILGALMGRKLASRTNVTRAGAAMRSWGRAASQREDIDHAQDDLEALQEQSIRLDEKLTAEIDKVSEQLDVSQLELRPLVVRPRKSDLQVERVAIVWRPWQVDAHGITQPAW